MVYNWSQLGKRTCLITFLHAPEASPEITWRWYWGFSLNKKSKTGRFFICGKSLDDNLYPYHVVLTTKAKDWRLRRSVKEKLSYTAQRNVLTYVSPHDPKHSAFLPTATVMCLTKKNSLTVSVVFDLIRFCDMFLGLQGVWQTIVVWGKDNDCIVVSILQV